MKLRKLFERAVRVKRELSHPYCAAVIVAAGTANRMRIFADDRCQTGVLSFLITGEDCELTAQRLGENGFCVRAGLHCAPLAHKSAGTLETGTVRISFSAFNTKKETERLIRYLKK